MTNAKIFLFIDSSIYIGTGFNFESSSLAAVRKYCQGNVVQLLIDSIIANEVTTHIKNDIGKPIVEANSKLKSSSLCGLKKAGRFDLLDESKLVDFILKLWSEFLDACKVNKLEYTDIRIADILTDYFNNTPPFENLKDKKNEFPDAIVIKSIKHFMRAQDENARLLVVSGDIIWKDCFESDSRVQFFENISAALEIISHTANGSVFCEIEKLLFSAYDDLKTFIQNDVIEKRNLFIDFDFEGVEEVYFRNIEFGCHRIESIKDDYALFTVEFIAGIVIDYDKFFSSGNKYLGHDAYRELHRLLIELAITLRKDLFWKIQSISLKNDPVVNENTLIEDLSLFCSECEVRLFSENETNGSKCRECNMPVE